jgi:transposase
MGLRLWECSCLYDWHKKFAPLPVPCGDEATVSELQAEVKQLRRKLKHAELEREILKKATAYFAKESQ